MKKEYLFAAVGIPMILFYSQTALAFTKKISSPRVPFTYRKLYSQYQTAFKDFIQYIDKERTPQKYPLVFGAELIVANGNREKELLKPNAFESIQLFLDRFQEMGIQGVTVCINYPLFSPAYPQHEDYIAFYKNVAKEVRKRNMILVVKSPVLFSDTAFSPTQETCRGLTFVDFKVGMKDMVKIIVQEISPDYLAVITEPDTVARLTGLSELNRPDKCAELVREVLAGLDRGTTKIGAGFGTWLPATFLQAYLKTDADFVNIHIYPLGEKVFANTIEILRVARENKKRVIIDECWFYKATGQERAEIAAKEQVFKRDLYSFWASLDQLFLEAMVKLSQWQHIEYISPFWSTNFFTYLEYKPLFERMSYEAVREKFNQQALENIIDGKFSSTGEFYKQLINASR